MKHITKTADKHEGEVIRHFKHLHTHPELSWRERETAAYIEAALDNLGIAHRRAGETGLIADIPATRPDATLLAFRADMDALPISEETGLPYASEKTDGQDGAATGVMHACGHDAHMAILLGLASALAETPERANAVRLVFQPAEESPPGGALQMIEAGALDSVNEIYALHVFSIYDCGMIHVRPGPLFASIDDFYVSVRGKGGHAAMPEGTVNPVTAAAKMAVALDDFAHDGDFVLAATSLHGGKRTNVIPETAELAGTFRTFSTETRSSIPKQVERILAETAVSYGAEIAVKWESGYPATVNDTRVAEKVRRMADVLFGESKFVTPDPHMVSEDFAYYLEKTPGCMFLVGCADGPNAFPHHHPQFRVAPDALKTGLAMFLALALKTGDAIGKGK